MKYLKNSLNLLTLCFLALYLFTACDDAPKSTPSKKKNPSASQSTANAGVEGEPGEPAPILPPKPTAIVDSEFIKAYMEQHIQEASSKCSIEDIDQGQFYGVQGSKQLGSQPAEVIYRLFPACSNIISVTSKLSSTQGSTGICTYQLDDAKKGHASSTPGKCSVSLNNESETFTLSLEVCLDPDTITNTSSQENVVDTDVVATDPENCTTIKSTNVALRNVQMVIDQCKKECTTLLEKAEQEVTNSALTDLVVNGLGAILDSYYDIDAKKTEKVGDVATSEAKRLLICKMKPWGSTAETLPCVTGEVAVQCPELETKRKQCKSTN